MTLSHANAVKARQAQQLCCVESEANACVISEIEGSMVLIVKTGQEGGKDKRKKKALVYREARLTLAHEQGSTTPISAATLGDGAVWIAHQIEEQFGAKGAYLVDFYHVCEYLSAAALACASGQERAWLAEQKALLKLSRVDEVVLSLLPYLESKTCPDEEAPVRICYRYMQSRV